MVVGKGVGDRNRKIETEKTKEKGEGERERILEVCMEYNIIIAKTKFKHKNIHKYTISEYRNAKQVKTIFW